MADEGEKVVYEFVGDSSSLQQATKAAIGSLDQYEDRVKQLAALGNLDVGKTAFTGFQRAANKIIRQTNDLSKFMSTASSDVMHALDASASSVETAAKNIQDVLDYMSGSVKLNTEDFKLMTGVLKEASQAMDTVSNRAAVLTSNFKSVKTISAPVDTTQAPSGDFTPSKSAEESAKVIENHYRMLASTTDHAYKDLQSKIAKTLQVEQAKKFAQEVDANYHLAGKSAIESAKVFVQASEVVNNQSGLGGFRAKLDQLRGYISIWTGEVSQRFHGLAGMFDPIVAKMKALEAKAESSNTKAGKMLKTILSAFRRLKQSSKDADDAADSVEDIGEEAEESSKKVDKLANSMGSLSGSTRLVKRLLAGLASLQIGKMLSQAVNQSIKFTENLNLFSVAMGDAFVEGGKFVGQMQELYGMDPSNLMRYAGNFYQLSDAIDMPGKAASNLSLGLTKAMVDISSLFNVDVETVFQDLSSGMQGMSRAVRKYGMDIRTTTLQQTALSLGMTEQVSKMSEANRQGLRFITMMHQARNATGDFAATIETPANQLRIFKEQMSQLGRAIGDLFIGPLSVAIQYINGFVMALRMVIQFIGSVLGLVNSFSRDASSSSESIDDVAASVDGVGSAAGGAAKQLRKMLAPFDELNILQQQADSGGGGGGVGGIDVGALDPAIADTIEQMQWKLDNIKMKAVEVRDALLDFFGFEYDNGKILSWDFEEFKNNVAEKFPLMTAIISEAIGVWNYLVDTFGATFRSLWGNVSNILKDIGKRLKELYNDVLKPLYGALVEALGWVFQIFQELWVDVIGPVVESIGNSLEQLWTRVVSPILTHVISIIGQIIEIVLNLWNNVLAPVLEWLVYVFGPFFGDVFSTIWDIVSAVFINIGEVVNGFFTIFDGIITFLAGVFAGDWERAWSGIVEIFTGIWGAISAAVAAPLNVAIGIINTFLSAIAGGINAAIRSINRLSITIPDWVPMYGGNTIGFSFDRITTPQIPYLANGGVVSSPTMAMIGEGKYDEAVIPLGNSPQMRELIDKISESVRSKHPNSTPIFKIYLDGKVVFDSVVDQARMETVRTGFNPLIGG